jgi:pimeloyl-ACP methyl ester carboxylesterase
MYDYTAAELAERNHAIVAAPSISGNLFDCDGCQLGGDPMHAAIAKLFLGDREALLASARAAGFEGDELPQRFVIAGHSGGGQLAAGAAGYFEQFAPDAEDHNLAGVLLYDTSPVGGAIARGVAKIPDDIPVYVIAAEPCVLNSYGGANEVLEAARPGQFVGVQLVGGVHLDPLQTHNPLVQFAASLIAGFPRLENVEAVQELAEGWINDWYEGSHTGVYGELGSTIDIPTTKGTAQAYVLPAPAPQLTLIDLFLNALMNSTAILNFAYCAEDPSAAAANEDLTENSTPNTVLSLDGKGSTGQSVGQHVCTG